MFNKKFIIPIIIIIIIVIFGFIRINIINTKALSPIGNSEDNYELVSAEFGEDFTEFIKDNAEVKIYTANGERETTVKIKNKDIRLKKDNAFIEVAVTTGTRIKDGFLKVKGKVDDKIEGINKKILEKENKNDKLDNTVNDFIKFKEDDGNSIKEGESEETNWEDNLKTGDDE